MKKSLKKLSLNKKAILTIKQQHQIKGASSCCVQTCGGAKTRPDCPFL